MTQLVSVKNSKTSLIGVSLIGFAMIVMTCSQPTLKADLVLLSGNVVTMDEAQPNAEAVAVHADTIMAVGTTEQIKALIGPETEVIHLGGQMIMPGFIESHAHFRGIGRSLMRLWLTSTNNYDEIVAMVSEAVANKKPGDWILGRGWHQEKWDRMPSDNIEGLPTHHALSKVSPDNPVILTHASGHAILANAKAMELAGVDRNTKDPDGGQIVRDKNGDPIGVFRENAELLIERAYTESIATRTAEETRAQALAEIELAGWECLKKGITSFCDAGASLNNIDTYRELADAGRLPVRLWVMVSDSNEVLETELPGCRMIGYGNNFLTVRAIKRSFDGALGSHGAWLLEPYDDLPSSRGLNTESVEVLRATARLAVEYDFQLCTHCIGDRANREILDIYEEALSADATGENHRWRIEHVQHLNATDIPRLAQLGVIASMQGVHCTSDGPWVPKRIGKARSEEGAYVWRKLIESGAMIVNGTDAPVEDVDPLACYYASVTRRLPDGSQFYPEQCMTRQEALQSYTINAAEAMFEEDIKGSITIGKLADMVVLSQDILTVPDDSLLNTNVLYTILGGKVAYRSE